MRRHYSSPPATGFLRTSPTTRLLTMVAFSFILVFVIIRARDPRTWEWFASNKGAKTTVGDELKNLNAEAHRQSSQGKPATAVAAAGKEPTTESKPDAPPPDAPASPPSANTPSAGAEPPPVSEIDQKPAEARPTGPQITGLTDEVPSEAVGWAKNSQAITDRTTKIEDEEMFAYRQVVGWVNAQPVEILKQRAKPDPRYNWFIKFPDEYRGKLFAMEVSFRLADLYALRGRDEESIPVLEAWGSTRESKERLCDFIIVDPPKDFPASGTIREKATFYGYFFKLTGYQTREMKPDAANQMAPTFFGRIVWEPPPPMEKSSGMDWFWFGIAGIAVGMFLLIRLAMYFTRGRRPELVSGSLFVRSKTPESEVNEWLDETFSENSDDSGESGNNSPWERDNHTGANGSTQGSEIPDKWDENP